MLLHADVTLAHDIVAASRKEVPKADLEQGGGAQAPLDSSTVKEAKRLDTQASLLAGEMF